MKTILAAVAGLACLLLALPAEAQSRAARELTELRQRVDQLEEQLVNLQVVVGTLESLASGQNASGAPRSADAYTQGYGQAGSDMAVRLRALETQVQALASQMRGGTPERDVSAGTDTQGGWQTEPRPARQNTTSLRRRSDGEGFGSVTISGGDTRDPITSLIENTDSEDLIESDAEGRNQTRRGDADGTGDGGQRVASLEDAGPDAVYERAYGHLLKQDYGAAQSAFERFIARFPQDERAGNAQFWLGESHYVRGQYRRAADAFLNGVKKYTGSQKAPDSLVKLAMSLARLGQKEAACATFAEVGSRFPNAAPHLRRRVTSERERAGC